MKTLGMLLAFCLFGVVDQIHGNAVLIEFEMSDNKLEYVNVPRTMIPCAVKEGDVIQFVKEDDILKINCAPPKDTP